MANRRASSPEDPLKPFMIYIPESQILFLKSLGKSASGFVRVLIATQMDGRAAAEISKLKQEITQTEAHLKIQYAQLREYEAETNKQQNTIILREDYLEKHASELAGQLNGFLHGDFSQVRRPIKARVNDLNTKILAGTGAAPVTVEELTERILKKAKAAGVNLRRLAPEEKEILAGVDIDGL